MSLTCSGRNDFVSHFILYCPWWTSHPELTSPIHRLSIYYQRSLLVLSFSLKPTHKEARPRGQVFSRKCLLHFLASLILWTHAVLSSFIYMFFDRIPHKCILLGSFGHLGVHHRNRQNSKCILSPWLLDNGRTLPLFTNAAV